VMYAGITCEYAPTQQLMSNPRHPYTAALIRSIPKLGQRVARLPTIEGTVPSLFELPKGCPFQNRCSNKIAQCSEERPPMQSVEPGHSVACFNPVAA